MADCTSLAYGFEPVGNTPDEFAAFIKKEMVKWVTWMIPTQQQCPQFVDDCESKLGAVEGGHIAI